MFLTEAKPMHLPVFQGRTVGLFIAGALLDTLAWSAAGSPQIGLAISTLGAVTGTVLFGFAAKTFLDAQSDRKARIAAEWEARIRKEAAEDAIGLMKSATEAALDSIEKVALTADQLAAQQKAHEVWQVTHDAADRAQFSSHAKEMRALKGGQRTMTLAVKAQGTAIQQLTAEVRSLAERLPVAADG